MNGLTVACLQLNTGNDLETNLAQAEAAVGKAAKAGAQWIMLPENALMMAENAAESARHAVPESDHPGVAWACASAARHQKWLLLGSVAVASGLPGESRALNRSLWISPQGSITARYDKIHLFDVALGSHDSSGGRYQESEKIAPGQQAVCVQTPHGGLGLSICYDLRFPHLYRALAKAGATMLTVPAAFTQVTGEAHWHALLRARAIENGAFVFAPAQCGQHPGRRQTYGHALIINPWGEILADAGLEPGMALATIDLADIPAARTRVPSLEHDREFTVSLV